MTPRKPTKAIVAAIEDVKSALRGWNEAGDAGTLAMAADNLVSVLEAAAAQGG